MTDNRDNIKKMLVALVAYYRCEDRYSKYNRDIDIGVLTSMGALVESPENSMLKVVASHKSNFMPLAMEIYSYIKKDESMSQTPTGLYNITRSLVTRYGSRDQKKARQDKYYTALVSNYVDAVGWLDFALHNPTNTYESNTMRRVASEVMEQYQSSQNLKQLTLPENLKELL